MFPAGENTSMLCQHINISAQQYPDQLQHQQISTQLYPAAQYPAAETVQDHIDTSFRAHQVESKGCKSCKCPGGE